VHGILLVYKLTIRCENFYDLPSTRTKRTTSFGFGSRGTPSLRQNSPPPGTYKVPSDFEFTTKKGNAYSFGISREAYAKVYTESHVPGDKAIPGPGSYNVFKAPGADASKFSFRSKAGDMCKLLFISI
jgi:hypothetical protein